MWNAQNITSVIVAGLSLIGTIATVAYVKMKSSFRDKQDTEITISNKINLINPEDTSNNEHNVPSAETRITITFNNDEKFASEMTKVKNGGEKTNQVMSLPNLSTKKNNKSKEEIEEDDDISFETHTHYDNALKINHEGDVIIGDNRKEVVEQARLMAFNFTTMNTEILKFISRNPSQKDIESHGNIGGIPFKNNMNLKFVSKSDPVKDKKSDKISDQFDKKKMEFSETIDPPPFKKTLSENDLTLHKDKTSEEFQNVNPVELGGEQMIMNEVDLENTEN